MRTLLERWFVGTGRGGHRFELVELYPGPAVVAAVLILAATGLGAELLGML